MIALGFDAFWDYKADEFMRSNGGTDDLLISPHEASRQFAARWTMIPITRAMDTIVIEIGNAESTIWRALRKVADKHPDIIEWYRN